MAPVDVGPDRPVEELLHQIEDGAPEGVQTRSATIIGPFSALLVRLSRDVEKTTKTVRRLSWVIAALTVTLLLLTGVLAWLTWVLVQEDYSSPEDDEANSQRTGFSGGIDPQAMKF
jgi:hypothetical protein